MTIRLNNGERVAVTRHDGSFVVPKLQDGLYVVEIDTSEWVFPSYSVLVRNGAVAVSTWDSKGHSKTIRSPFRLEAIGKPQYFLTRASMNMFSMLMNPQMMIMGFMLIMVL